MVDKLNKLIKKNEVKKEHLSKNNCEKKVINLTAVSYTHLDVYKRQEQRMMEAPGLERVMVSVVVCVMQCTRTDVVGGCW